LVRHGGLPLLRLSVKDLELTTARRHVAGVLDVDHVVFDRTIHHHAQNMQAGPAVVVVAVVKVHAVQAGRGRHDNGGHLNSVLWYENGRRTPSMIACPIRVGDVGRRCRLDQRDLRCAERGRPGVRFWRRDMILHRRRAVPGGVGRRVWMDLFVQFVGILAAEAGRAGHAACAGMADVYLGHGCA
jgi:hypothetical protein